MICKAIVLNACLSLCLHSTLFGQRIGAIEKNIYHVFDNINDKSKDYRLFIRELFEKKKGTWLSIYNAEHAQSNQSIKTSTQYLLQEPKKTIIVKAFKVKADMESRIAHELFRIQMPLNIKLNPLPPTILKGFEKNDIIATRIVTDKKVKRLDISLFKVEYLNDTLKNKLYNLLVAKYESCYGENDTTYFMAIKRSHIHNTVRWISNSIRLGKVDIVSGNICFAEENNAYGGGILHYLIYPDQTIQLLVSNTELIDVADYDNDGNFEYVFFKSSFNNYGYIMYFDKFQNRVVNEWFYH